MSTTTKTIKVALEPGTSIHKSKEIIAAKRAGWQIVLIIPQGKDGRGLLVCDVQMVHLENRSIVRKGTKFLFN